MKYARRGGALGLGLVLLAVAWPASAQGWLTGAFAAPGSGATVAEPSQEVWAGADVSAKSWSAYTGIMAALFGSLQADGWRVRAVGGYGAYAYPKHGIKVRGDVSYTDVLVGAHRQLGPLTVKAFVGVSTEAHVLTPLDLDNEALGAALGAKAVLETWLELSPRSWASIDLSGSTVHGGDYAARARAGYRLWPELSLGLEAAGTGDGEYGSGRGGAFLRYTWASGEVSAAAGASIDRTGESSGYGALNALYRY